MYINGYTPEVPKANMAQVRENSTLMTLYMSRKAFSLPNMVTKDQTVTQY